VAYLPWLARVPGACCARRTSDTVEAAGLLPSFDKPALVIWAADDRFFPREHGRRLADLLPQGRFELVEDSRTFIPEDNPSALVHLIERG
jgi:pimeloyl-ACP methyl ester carboxylesterase